MTEQTTLVAAAAPPAEEVEHRERQRAALRDLVELATACATTEGEIEERLAKSLAEAEDLNKKNARQMAERDAAEVEQVTAEYEMRQTEAQSAADVKVSELHQWDRSARQNIRNEIEPLEREIKSKFDHAVWMAESVAEMAEQQIKIEAKKVKEEVDAKNDALTASEAQAWQLLGTHQLVLPEDAAEYVQPLTNDPRADYDNANQNIGERLAALKQAKSPKFLVGPKLYIVAAILGGVASAIAQIAAVGTLTPPNWQAIASAFVLVAGAIIGWGFYRKGSARKHIIPLRQSLSTASRATAAQMEASVNEQAIQRTKAAEARRAEVLKAREKFKPMINEAARRRDAGLEKIQKELKSRSNELSASRAKVLKEIEDWKDQATRKVEQSQQAARLAATKAFEDRKEQAQQRYAEARVALEARLNEGLAHIHSPIAEVAESATQNVSWDDPAWKTWKPPMEFASAIRIGELEVDLKSIANNSSQGSQVCLALPERFKMPVTLGFPKQASLLIQADREGRPQAIRTLQTAMARLLTSLPAGRVRFTILDPVGLGQNFAGFMHLADHDDALIGGRIWTEAEQIEQKLTNLTEHMETVIQKYLRNEFDTIDDYNAQAGELAEPYRFLVVADFPNGFQGNAYRRLASIAATGARCGVYTLVSRDTRQPLPGGTHLEELEASSINIVQQGDTFVWKDKVFGQFPLTLDPPPREEVLTGVLDKVGKGAKAANRVEVPFDTIAPSPEEIWSRSSSEDLVVPIGRLGATRLQYLKLGKGVAQHALLAGKTGSGKSTLLHAIVTNIAMWYSPDEVEVYLIDFKKGVEFKTYAVHHLPHARAIAVESDREFGLSVLQRLDAELARRGEIFRRLGVQDLTAYRRDVAKTGDVNSNANRIPRTLLIIDEFQEFFSEDDKLAQEAGLLLDRLVRQGRAFGIHLLLGSQTIGGTSGLARSTIGQMAVRIALQTSEADSQLILGDNNSAARLLSRPGEAIYNDAGGLVEGNSPFQVAWLPDEKREKYLAAVEALSAKTYKGNGAPDAVIFEGNAAADIRTNQRLARLLEAPARPATASMAPLAWLGDPVAIKDPTSIVFRRQSGANVLIIGQQEESAMAMMVSAMVGVAAQSASTGATFYLLDGSAADSPLAGIFSHVKASLPNEVKQIDYRAVGEAMNELGEELKRRQAGTGGTEGIFVFIYGLQRYRVLRKSEDSFGGFSMSSGDDDAPKVTPADKQFADLLKEGPEHGIHIIAWVDTAVSLDRTLDRNAMREFDNRILFQMSANDSSNLIDSPAANKLGFHRALAYSEEQGVTEKFRPYALPEKAWLDQAKHSLSK